MSFVVVSSSRAIRRLGGKKMCSGPILAALSICISVGAARANPSTPTTGCTPETRLIGPVMVVPCPAARKLVSLLDYRPSSPILTVRTLASAFADIAISIPELHFGQPSPKLVNLTSLTPPATLNALDDQSDAPAPPMIVGIASTYNPLDPKDKDAGGLETASGEFYDPDGWTAAIRIDLRERFGGVRFGRNYRPTYALVEAGEKRVVVKINDVGPLRPGRIIDLNERAMRYFDPSLQLGLINGIRVTPLPGTNWVSGPVGTDEHINVVGL